MQQKFKNRFKAQEQWYQEKQEKFVNKLFAQFNNKLRDLEEKFKGNQPSATTPPKKRMKN